MWLGRLDTINMYDVCYNLGQEADIVSETELIVKMNTQEKQFLPICRDYFGRGIFIQIQVNTKYLQKMGEEEKENYNQTGNHLDTG